MAKSYYAILGVLPTATLDEIRSAYRNMVKQYHPDHFGKNSAPFLSIQEAYDVLGDEENRRSYDRRQRESGIRTSSTDPSIPVEIRRNRSSVEPLRATRRPVDLGTIFSQSSFDSCFPSFDEIFDSLWNIFDRPSAAKSERFQTLTMEVPITQDQANQGGRVRINLPVQHPCPVCNGLGDTGLLGCWRCDGSGIIRNELSLHVEYPPGIRDSYRVAIPLNRYGIQEICPVLLFRIINAAGIEELF